MYNYSQFISLWVPPGSFDRDLCIVISSLSCVGSFYRATSGLGIAATR